MPGSTSPEAGEKRPRQQARLDTSASERSPRAPATAVGAHRAPVENAPERTELLREAATMVLYVSVVEIAELAAVPERHLGHGVVTGPVGSKLLAVVWGTAVGLALAHWFAFGIAAHGLRGERLTRHDFKIGMVQLGGAAFVAAIASLPVLLFSNLRAQETTGDVPAVLIGVIGYALARAAGKPRVPSLFFGLTALALGVAVALVKIRLAAH